MPGCSEASRIAITIVIYDPLTGNPANQIRLTPQSLFQLRQFFGLSDDQVNGILKENIDYNSFSLQQQRQIQNAQSQIALETNKDQLDPMEIGTLYAGIESACRELKDRAVTSQRQNVSILTDGQKAKLSVLNEAVKLAPIISAAEFGNLLGSVGSPPSTFDTGSTLFGRLDPAFPSGVLGCATQFRGSFVFGSTIPASRMAPVAPHQR